MASQKKVVANKINAKASTGPKTPKGKAIASANATRHGILSQELMLSNEKPQEFDLLLSSLITELGAWGTLECALVERIAVAIWRQRRLVRAERENIEGQNKARKLLNASSDGSGGQSQVESQTDGPLTDFTESQIQEAETADALVREMVLFMRVSGLSEEEYAKYFPLMAQDFSLNGALRGISDTVKILRENNELQTDEQQKESAGIAIAREHIARLRANKTVAQEAIIASNTESLTRYQAALDNEWYKAMRAFREARQHRLRTLENVENSA